MNEDLKAAADLELPPAPIPAPSVEAAPMQPVCPHCGADPMMVNTAGYQIPMRNGSMHFMNIPYCSNPSCRKALGVYLIGIKPPEIIGAAQMPPGTLLHRPS